MIGQAERVIWVGGEHEFCFAIGELRALEQRCDAGIAVIFTRLVGSQFSVNDVIDTLRIGLQGAGMSEREALKVIERSYASANVFDLAVTAARVLGMFISWPTGKGVDEPDEGKPMAEPTKSPSSTDAPAGQDMSGPLQ